MNGIYKSVAIAVFGLISLNTTAQETKKEIKKEVKMTEINGEKVLTIQTSENGQVTEETYKGEAAEQKLNEAESGTISQESTEEINVEEVNGEKVLTIKKSSNGIETIEVLKGEAAEERLKQMETEGSQSNQAKPVKKSMKKVEVRKVEVKEKE